MYLLQFLYNCVQVIYSDSHFARTGNRTWVSQWPTAQTTKLDSMVQNDHCVWPHILMTLIPKLDLVVRAIGQQLGEMGSIPVLGKMTWFWKMTKIHRTQCWLQCFLCLGILGAGSIGCCKQVFRMKERKPRLFYIVLLSPVAGAHVLRWHRCFCKLNSGGGSRSTRREPPPPMDEVTRPS